MNFCIFFGRMQPIHKAHAKAIAMMKQYSDFIKGQPFVATSSTHDNDSNPLTFEQKSTYIKKVCDDLNVNFYDKPVKKVYDLLRDFAFKCEETGGGKVILFCGSDRVESYQKLADSIISKYQGRNECLNVSIEVDKVMERDDLDAYSASQMRQLVADNDFEEFSKHCAFDDIELQKRMYDDIMSAQGHLVESFISKFSEAMSTKSISGMQEIAYHMAEKINAHTNQLSGKPDKLYYVGGCVRDLAMGKKPNDFDLLTTMYYKDYAAMFDTEDIRFRGKQIVVVPVVEGEEMETCCLKKNENLERNLAERDLTINAMAQDVFTDEIIDPTNGLQDIENKILRIPEFRRNLIAKGQYPTTFFRVIRFYSTLGWDFEDKTLKALKSFGKSTNYKLDISQRQFEHDWVKFVKGKNAVNACKLLEEIGLNDYMKEHFKPYEDFVKEYVEI